MSGTISPTCSAMKRSYSRLSIRPETVAPAGPPIVRSMIPQAAPRRRRARVSRCAPSRSFKLYRSFQRSKESPHLERGPSLLSSVRETLSSGHGSTNYLFFCFFLGRFRQVMQSILAAIFFLPRVARDNAYHPILRRQSWQVISRAKNRSLVREFQQVRIIRCE